MNFLRARKSLNISKIIEKIENKTRKILLFKYYNKKREIIRKSGISGEFFWRMLGSPKITDIRNLFFNNKIFAYSNKEEKENIIEYLKDNCSREINNCINYADKVIRKEFDIFEKTHLFEKKINWHYSFNNHFIWKLQKSEKMDIRPKYKQVDVKYTWEFNRHQFLTYLGFAYYYTKDERYAKEFKHLIIDWIKSNPPLRGINWYSGLEISIRLITWIFTLYFFDDSKEINNEEFFKKIFISLFQHAYYLKYFYTRSSFNHTVGDLFGIYFFSKIFKELKPIKKWENYFFKKFKKQIYLQTRLDGTNIEQSVNYHRFVLEFFSLFLILNPNALDQAEREIIEKMYNYLLFSIKPNKSFPLIGDLDDGKVLLLTFHNKNPFNILLNLGSILFQRENLKNLSETIEIPSILLLGIEGYKTFNNLKSQEPRKKIKYFRNAGYAIMRNNWTSKANYIFVDNGNFGPKSAGHSHSSISNFVFSHKGKDIIIDSGTYTYNKSLNERNLFRSSKAHNVLTINSENQAKLGTYFAWGTKPKIKRSFKENNGLFELTCYHDGYKGFLVKRKIVTNIDLNNIIIEDYVFPTINISNRKPDEINIFIHFNNDVKIRLEENRVIINNELSLEVSSNQDFQMNIEKGLRSPHYGFKYEIEVLNIHITHNFENGEEVYVKSELKSLK